jgi:hypothetical protein
LTWMKLDQTFFALDEIWIKLSLTWFHPEPILAFTMLHAKMVVLRKKHDA